MGDRGEKKTNKMLAEQGQQYNRFADVMGQRGAAEYDYGTGARSNIDKAYWDLYKGMEGAGGGGGGGGPAYQMAQYKDPRENEAQAMYREWAKTGGISPEQEATFRARATSSLPGFYEGIAREMRGAPSVGFGSQMAKLAREQGRGLAEAGLGAEADILGKRLSGQQWGGTGLERTDESLIERQMRVERERIGEQKAAQAAAAAAANRRAGASSDAFRNRMAILGELRGLRGEQGTDLAYADRQLAGMGGGFNTINARRQEQSLLDKIGQGAGIAGQLGGAAAGAMGVGVPGKGGNKPVGMKNPYATGG
jgi:hypothetical protein